jgi:histidinol-phosphate aminotransferase
MAVRTRPELEAIGVYRPGRSAADLGIAEAMKLSSNELPWGPLPTVVRAIEAGIAELNRYPDLNKTNLAIALAESHGVDPLQVTIGNGSVALLQHLVNAVAGAGDEVLFAARSFEAYGLAAVIGGATPVTVALAEGFRHDLPAMADAITERTRMILLCTPNNPTGPVIHRDELTEFLGAVPDDVLVVVDEAYQDFVTDPDAAKGLELLAAHSNLAVLRTFSKAYGLAGLRVGYCISQVEVADVIRKVSTPFGVSSLAQVAALASLAPSAQAELRVRVEKIVAERVRVSAALIALGAPVVASEANFVFLALGAASAAFVAGCERAGIILRPSGTDGVRVTIGTRADNDKFLLAADAALSSCENRR